MNAHFTPQHHHGRCVLTAVVCCCRYLGIYWQEEIIPFFEKVKLTEGKTVSTS